MELNKALLRVQWHVQSNAACSHLAEQHPSSASIWLPEGWRCMCDAPHLLGTRVTSWRLHITAAGAVLSHRWAFKQVSS